MDEDEVAPLSGAARRCWFLNDQGKHEKVVLESEDSATPCTAWVPSRGRSIAEPALLQFTAPDFAHCFVEPKHDDFAVRSPRAAVATDPLERPPASANLITLSTNTAAILAFISHVPGHSDPSVRAFVATSVRLYEALVQQPIIVRRGFTKVSSIVPSSADLVSNVRTFMSSLDLGAAPQEPCLGTDAFASRSFGTLARIKRIAGAEARLVSKSEAVAAHEAEEAETARGTTVLIKTGPHAGEQGVIEQQNKTKQTASAGSTF